MTNYSGVCSPSCLYSHCSYLPAYSQFVGPAGGSPQSQDLLQPKGVCFAMGQFPRPLVRQRSFISLFRSSRKQRHRCCMYSSALSRDGVGIDSCASLRHPCVFELTTYLVARMPCEYIHVNGITIFCTTSAEPNQGSSSISRHEFPVIRIALIKANGADSRSSSLKFHPSINPS